MMGMSDPLYTRREKVSVMQKILVAGLALLGCAASAVADDDPADAQFRSCVAEVEAAAITTTYHHCTGALATSCGSAATAKDAVDCINTVRDHLEAHLQEETDALLAAHPDKRDDMTFFLSDARGAGDSSCAVMLDHDIRSGLAVGQRAVNAAFCNLIVSGDLYAMSLKLETGE